MAVPVINSTQSVLGYPQWQPWIFQPLATNQPTSWLTSALPPGVTFDTTTGRVMGPATMPGVYLFQLQAVNASGTSEAKVFTLGIEASGYVQPSNIVEVFIDLTTRLVSLSASLANVQAQGNTASTPTDEKELKKVSPLFWVKAGDDVIFNVRFLKGNVPADLALVGLKFALKEFEPETVLVDNGANTWAKLGLGADASYRLAVKIESAELRAALTNYEDDQATQFLALGEFEWTETNTYTPKVGPDVLRSSSRTFGVMLPRDLIANPAA